MTDRRSGRLCTLGSLCAAVLCACGGANPTDGRDDGMAVATSASAPGQPLTAFPGAVGYGAATPGGRGGWVIYVTNLDDQGPGSLREALSAKDARTIVFGVSGTIEAKSDLEIRNPYVTVAGQTAPGAGITLKNAQLKILTHDVIVRFLRVRLGDLVRADRDAVSISNARNVMLDHISASWSVDETVSVADSQNITLQWSIVSEPLNDSVHSEGPHGKCSLIRGSEYVSVYRTLFAHCPDRSPHFSGKRAFQPKMQAVNNLVFDYGESAVKIEAKDDPYQAVGWFDIVGNYFIGGPKSRYEIAVKQTLYGARMFVAGNIGPHRPGSADDEWKVVKTEGSPRSALEVSSPSLNAIAGTVDAAAARDSVLQFAGSLLPQRDAVDLRIIEDVVQRRTGYVNSQSTVGGWPALASTSAPVDSDGDGLPDQWELALGLDPADPADGRSTDGNGYTLLENYLNALAAGAFPK